MLLEFQHQKACITHVQVTLDAIFRLSHCLNNSVGCSCVDAGVDGQIIRLSPQSFLSHRHMSHKLADFSRRPRKFHEPSHSPGDKPSHGPVEAGRLRPSFMSHANAQSTKSEVCGGGGGHSFRRGSFFRGDLHHQGGS